MLEVWRSRSQSCRSHLLPWHVRTDAGRDEHELLACRDVLSCNYTPVTHQRSQQLHIGMNDSTVPL